MCTSGYVDALTHFFWGFLALALDSAKVKA
jgi:hypothetical protein